MDDANATSAEGQESDVGQDKHRQSELKYSMTELLSKYSAQRWKSLPSSSEATTAEESQPLRRSSQSCVNGQSSRVGAPGEEPATYLEGKEQQEVNVSERLSTVEPQDSANGVSLVGSSDRGRGQVCVERTRFPTPTRKRNSRESIASDQKQNLGTPLYWSTSTAPGGSTWQGGSASNHRYHGNEHNATRSQQARLETHDPQAGHTYFVGQSSGYCPQSPVPAPPKGGKERLSYASRLRTPLNCPAATLPPHPTRSDMSALTHEFLTAPTFPAHPTTSVQSYASIGVQGGNAGPHSDMDVGAMRRGSVLPPDEGTDRVRHFPSQSLMSAPPIPVRQAYVPRYRSPGMREDVVGSENGGMSGVSDFVGAVGAQRVGREGALDSMGGLVDWGQEGCGQWNDTPSPQAAARRLFTFPVLEQQLKGLQDEDDKHRKRLVWII